MTATTAATPPEHRRFPTLDGYRAIAALMVVTTHVAFNTGAVLTPIVGPLMGRMDFGVTLFFLLSGFLLYRPWAAAAYLDRRGPAVPTYLLRRFARILPAYWVMAVFTLLALPEVHPAPLRTWLANLGLVHIYLPGTTVEGLTQTWSLATEVAFYLLLPVLAGVAGLRHRGDPDRSARWQLTVLAVVAVAAFAFNLARVRGGFGDLTIAGFWLPGFLDWFALGMACAVVQTRLSLAAPPRWMRSARSLANDTATCLTIAGAVFVVAATPVAGPLLFTIADPATLLIKHALYAACALALLLPAFLGSRRDGAWNDTLASGPMTYLGTISYGIFLWHLVLLRLLMDALQVVPFTGGFWFLWPLTVLSTVAVASVSWFVVEAPLQRLTHRRGGDRPGPPRPTDGARARPEPDAGGAAPTPTPPPPRPEAAPVPRAAGRTRRGGPATAS